MDDITILSNETLTQAGFINGFSTRQGGVSPLPKDDLNLAYKDDLDSNVSENRKRFLTTFQQPHRRIVTVKQTHSSTIIDIHAGNLSEEEQEGDALISKEPNILIGVKTADCLPILLGDPTTQTFAAVHAGWRGTSSSITLKTLQHMNSKWKVNLQNLIVVYGPYACGDCYAVGPEIKEKFEALEPFAENPFRSIDDQLYFDAQKANTDQLLMSGVKRENIHHMDSCTMHQNELFFSYRKEGKRKMGRLLSVVGLV